MPRYVRIFKGLSSSAVCGAEAWPQKLMMVTKNKLLALLLKIIVIIMFEGSIAAEISSEHE